MSNANFHSSCVARWLLLACVFPSAAIAQGNGDYDGDYDVDGDDFANWGVCMTGLTGPYVEPWSACSRFDFDDDHDVDLLDLGAFQAAFQAPPSPVCTPAPNNPDGSSGRYYAQAQIVQQAIGTRASISAHPTKLCGEPSATDSAFSCVYTGVTRFVHIDTDGDGVNDFYDPQQWAQVGYCRERMGGGLGIVVGIYAETQAGPGPADYDYCVVNIQNPGCNSGLPIGYFGDDGLPDFPYEYKCYKIVQSSPTWYYEVNNTLLHSWYHLDWAGFAGTDIEWQAELVNFEDDMVGTAQNHCLIINTQYRRTLPDPFFEWWAFPTYNLPGDVGSDDSAQWMIVPIFPGGEQPIGVELWDVNPNP